MGYSKQLKYKIGLLAIKYIPIIMFIIMWVHVGLLLIGYKGACADILVGSAIIPSLLILAMSDLFCFCLLHKALTMYSLVVDLCISFERLIGFKHLLCPCRIFIFICGISLFIFLIFKFRDFKNRNIKIKKI